MKFNFDRKIKSIHILPLHGVEKNWPDVGNDISFTEGYPKLNNLAEPLKGSILWVLYNNGDEMKGEFKTKDAAISFLTRLK